VDFKITSKHSEAIEHYVKRYRRSMRQSRRKGSFFRWFV